VRLFGTMPIPLLIVDDEASTRSGLQAGLEEKYDVYTAAGADEAFELMTQIPFGVILTDLRMVGKSGLKVIDRALGLSPQPVVIMMTAYGNIETAVEAMRRGATDFLQKPLNLEKLELVIERALKSQKLQTENTQLKARLDEKYGFEAFIGQSPAIEALKAQIRQVAPSRASVLMVGPTGSGKELAAQAIHQHSPRKDAPFIAVNCAALSGNLLESELFGHEKGAFTGAAERRVGRFEAADGGTLFLDEVGEIDAATQVKLLRFLESRSFERVGSNAQIKVDVRLLAATHRNLEQLVAEGKFREDLYYRLNVVKLMLPGLAERREDIPLLLEYFVGVYARENWGKGTLTFAPAALARLTAYDWPGNIRQLRNFAERMVVMSAPGAAIEEQMLDSQFWQQGGAAGALPTLSVEQTKERLVREALAKTKGNKSAAAALLGISRRTLHRKIKEGKI
jgi:two-component system, NtrC family, response regulator AtoC